MERGQYSESAEISTGSKKANCSIVHWPFDGITISNIILFSSETKLLYPNTMYNIFFGKLTLSECTKVSTILSLTAYKNAFWRLPLIDWTFNWGQFHLSINIEFPDNQ